MMSPAGQAPERRASGFLRSYGGFLERHGALVCPVRARQCGAHCAAAISVASGVATRFAPAAMTRGPARAPPRLQSRGHSGVQRPVRPGRCTFEIGRNCPRVETVITDCLERRQTSATAEPSEWPARDCPRRSSNTLIALSRLRRIADIQRRLR